MKVLDLPELDRPRERLLSRGAAALSDRELLALILGSGLPGCDAIELAAMLIGESGGLPALATADPHALKRLPGVGAAKAARVAAAFELARRATTAEDRRRIAGSADVAAVAAPYLRGLRHERVVVVACDNSGGLLRVAPLTEGSADRSLIPVRDVLSGGPRGRRHELRGSPQPPGRQPEPQPAGHGSDRRDSAKPPHGGRALPGPRNPHRDGLGEDPLKPPAKRCVEQRQSSAASQRP